MTIRLVIADDHVLLRAGLVAIFGTEPQLEVVAECEDGPAAVAMCAKYAPDIVLMDVQMPGGDGITATEEILRRFTDVRVIVLTLFDLDDYVIHALRAGASGFLLKTTPPQELIQRVLACARGELVLGSTVMSRLVESYVRQVPPSGSALLGTLTERERDVLRAMSRGLPNAEIGADLYLAETTVKTHVSRILEKFGARDRVQAIVIAHRHGIDA